MESTSTHPDFDSTVKTKVDDNDQNQQEEQSTSVSFVNNDARITPSAVLQYVIDNDQPYDTVITCADGKIGAHRLVLASASPFIGSMFCSFSHRLGEIATLILPDVRVEIMKALLNFCYTGKLLFLKEDESEILDAMRYLFIGEFGNLTRKKVSTAEPVTSSRRSTTSTSNPEQAIINQNADDRVFDQELTPERSIPPCDSSSGEEESEGENENDNNIKDQREESSQDDLFEEIVHKKKKSRKRKTAPEPTSGSDNQLNQSLQSIQEEEAGLQTNRSPPPPPGKKKPKNTKRGASTPTPTQTLKQMPAVLAMLHKASQKRKLTKEGNAENDTLLSPGSTSGYNPTKRLRHESGKDLPVAIKTRRQTLLGPLRERDNAPSFKTKPARKGVKQKLVDLDLSNLPINFIRIRYPRLFVSEECLKMKDAESAESNIPHPSPTANANPKKNEKSDSQSNEKSDSPSNEKSDSPSKEKSQNSSQDSFHPPSVENDNYGAGLSPDPDPDEADSSIRSTNSSSKESVELLDI